MRFIAAIFFLLSLESSIAGESSLELLSEAYERSELLFIGLTNHDKQNSRVLIKNFLSEKLDDPDLMFIAIERPHDHLELYAALSLVDFSRSDYLSQLGGSKALDSVICSNAEWAHFAAEVMPLVREANESRKESVIVLPTDGLSTQIFDEFFNPAVKAIAELKSGDCEYAENVDQYYRFPLISLNRERASAKFFKERIWNQLEAGKKAIVIYHAIHLLTEFESCVPEQLQDGSWVSNWAPSSWLAHFLSSTPEAENSFQIVVLDELSGQNPDGFLRVSAKQASEFNYTKKLAIKTSDLVEEGEIGVEMFTDKSYIRKHWGGQHRSRVGLSEIFDGVIWIPGEALEASFPSPRESLPNICL